MDPEITRRLIGLAIWVVAILIGIVREKRGLKLGGVATISFVIGFCVTLA